MSIGAVDDDGGRAVAAAADEHAPGAAADVAVLDHLTALDGVDVELDELEAVGALHLHGVVHAGVIARVAVAQVRGCALRGIAGGVLVVPQPEVICERFELVYPPASL